MHIVLCLILWPHTCDGCKYLTSRFTFIVGTNLTDKRRSLGIVHSRIKAGELLVIIAILNSHMFIDHNLAHKEHSKS
jgi:hypothetical protein